MEDCKCHCHNEPMPSGIQCKCIKNCKHCHPENFKKEALLKKLKEFEGLGDTEAAHGYADDALIEYINDKEITDAYEAIDKWYS